MLGTVAYREGQPVTGRPDTALLPAGCYFETDTGCGSHSRPGTASPCVVSTRVKCGGAFVVAGRKVPTWLLVAATGAVVYLVTR